MCLCISAVAKAVLDCIEQSRRLVLVPCSLNQGQNQDQGQGHNQDNSSKVHHGLLSGLDATLVEYQTQLILIQTEAPHSDSHTDQDQAHLPEAVHLLAQAGHTVTWRGSSSSPLSSPFWKQLRFSLPSKRRQRPPHTPLSCRPCSCLGPSSPLEHQ